MVGSCQVGANSSQHPTREGACVGRGPRPCPFALALVACRFTDKPHDQSFIEAYADVSKGSGQALLDAIGKFSARSQHAEVATAPLLLWGMSAGGEFNYEFAVWKPERVAAFIVKIGGSVLGLWT